MSLIDRITPDERVMIDDRRGLAYCGSGASYCSLDILLDPWETNKSRFLSKLFKDSLILKKPININAPTEEIANAMKEHFFSFSWGTPNNDGSWTVVRLREAIDELFINDRIDKECYCALTAAIGSMWMFARNCFEYVGFETNHSKTFTIQRKNSDKTYTIAYGMKLMKVLRKISDAVGGVTGFEELVVEHSQVLNSTKITGNLCLSIHPLDYMTMSDNNCDWSSCMSWDEEGSYRQGTVEMMNSKNIIVGYVEASSPMHIAGYEWNNKKYRSLYFCNESLITNIKGYPYFAPGIDEVAVKWIKELVEENYDIKYQDEIQDFGTTDCKYRISLETNLMYNDCRFNSCSNEKKVHIGFLNAKEAENREVYIFEYSGPSECMICGATDCIDDYRAEDLSCEECCDYEVCSCCGGHFREEEMSYVDGKYYCDSCYDSEVGEDCIDFDEHATVDMITIRAVKDNPPYMALPAGDDKYFDESNAEKFYTKILPDLINGERTLRRIKEKYPLDMLCPGDIIKINIGDLTNEGRGFFNMLVF